MQTLNFIDLHIVINNLFMIICKNNFGSLKYTPTFALSVQHRKRSLSELIRGSTSVVTCPNLEMNRVLIRIAKG